MTTEATNNAADAGAQGSGCPFGFDPIVPDHVVSPWPTLARLREEHPVFFMPHLGMWCVTRHEDVLAILKDTKTYAMKGGYVVLYPLPEGLGEIPSYLFPEYDGLMQADPPHHTRLRKLLQPAFRPSRVKQWENDVRGVADQLIDGFIGDGSVDLVSRFSTPFPTLVMARLLGFSDEDATNFRRWTDSYLGLVGIPGLPEDQVRALWGNVLECHAAIETLVQQRRDNPLEDIISDLVMSKTDDGEASLSNDEIVHAVLQFIVGGTDTTSIVIPTATRFLLEERSRWNELQADPSLIPGAIEETVRFRGVVRGVKRVTVRDVQISGVDIPAGSALYVMFASANHDENYFENPQEFDLHREMSYHLGFGRGTHFCIGAPLGRLEARIALEQLVSRIPSLRLVPQDIEYSQHLITPMPTSLQLEWDV